jgi:uncharacterized protein YodC (DUF2158 family)
MAEAFQVGDLVKLRSGGPKMTVQSVNAGQEDQLVHCVWFEQGSPQSHTFPAGALEGA